jgi:predicted DNA-binding protein (UPF0251 family)
MKEFERLIQQEKWNKQKRAWREKVKKYGRPQVEGDRRHPRAKLTLDEEGLLFLDFLKGATYATCSDKYEVSTETIRRIILYWQGRCLVRFRSKYFKEELEESEVIKDENEPEGFFSNF